MIEDLVGSLSKETGMGLSDVRRVLWTAPRRYKIYEIDKRSGGKREIAHPARELKVLQRAFLKLALEGLPVHGAATAYRKGHSLRDNAAPHAGAGVILKMDFHNFFPSIRGKDWTSYCSSHNIFLRQDDVDLSANLLFRKPIGASGLRLSIGAPTSPVISNLLLFDFDKIVWEAAAEQFVTYTRYADDMTFSAPRAGYLIGIQSMVAKTVREMRFPKLEINGEKTKVVTPRYHRDVTGLTLSNDGRVTIGQLRKRNIRAGVHNAFKGELSEKEIAKLAGHIAFAFSVEPDFIDHLKARHGGPIVDRIMKSMSEGTTKKGK